MSNDLSPPLQQRSVKRPTIEADEVCEIAVALARNTGWPVFPCTWTTKAPTIPGEGGFKHAVTDPDGIAELWRLYPGELIGIPTGEASGLDVLDLDFAKHREAFLWWQAASPQCPPTRSYRSRSGGRHLYFRHAPGVRKSESKLARGVDIRGEGGYIIFWYGAGLKCLNHTPPTDWPGWLLDCVLWEKPKAAIPPLPAGQPTNPDRAIDGILRTVAEAAPGGWNSCLFWGAARLCERASAGQIGRDEARGLLMAAAQCAGLDTREAQRTISSAFRGAA